MRMWAVLTAIVQVPAAAFDEFAVGGRLQLRQFADEHNDIPDIFITCSCSAGIPVILMPCLIIQNACSGQSGRSRATLVVWVRPTLVRFLHPGARWQSTHGVVVSCTQSDARVLSGRGRTAASALDRTIAHDTENLACHRPVGLICGNVEQTRMNKYRNADDANPSGNNQYFHCFQGVFGLSKSLGSDE